MTHLYFLSGLGADERIFQFLNLPGYPMHHIQWVLPKLQESLKDYAKRLLPQIKHERPTLIGLSFGGIVAVELAKLIPVEQVILISSVKTKYELPSYFQLLNWLPLYQYLPTTTLHDLGLWSLDWWFSLESSSENELLTSLIVNAGDEYIRWAVNEVVNWDNVQVPSNLHQLHGEGDRIFPIPYIKPTCLLPNAGHFMIVNRADQVSKFILSVLD